MAERNITCRRPIVTRPLAQNANRTPQHHGTIASRGPAWYCPTAPYFTETVSTPVIEEVFLSVALTH